MNDTAEDIRKVFEALARDVLPAEIYPDFIARFRDLWEESLAPHEED